MNDKNLRKYHREPCFAHVLIEQVVGQLRDITPEGFRMVFIENPQITADSVKTLQIIPDESMEIEEIQLKGRIKWIRSDPYGTLIGIKIVDFSSKIAKEKYNILLNYYE